MWQCCTYILPRLAETQTQFPLLPFLLLLPNLPPLLPYLPPLLPLPFSLPSIPISAELEDLLSKLLEKSPEHRITIPEIRVSQSVTYLFYLLCSGRTLLGKRACQDLACLFMRASCMIVPFLFLSLNTHMLIHTQTCTCSHTHTHTCVCI